jgi:hypothetical protein
MVTIIWSPSLDSSISWRGGRLELGDGRPRPANRMMSPGMTVDSDRLPSSWTRKCAAPLREITAITLSSAAGSRRTVMWFIPLGMNVHIASSKAGDRRPPPCYRPNREPRDERGGESLRTQLAFTHGHIRTESVPLNLLFICGQLIPWRTDGSDQVSNTFGVDGIRNSYPTGAVKGTNDGWPLVYPQLLSHVYILWIRDESPQA